MVWVNTDSHIYHKEGSRFYGRTEKGKYMTEAEAIRKELYACDICESFTYFMEMSNVTPVFPTGGNHS